jgi:predicted nuclease of predicted toxin-antitoxin system
MKILIDMNLSPRSKQRTRFRNHGLRQHNNGYVVITHDLDFGAMLAATQGEKPSVVQIRADDVSPVAIGTQVITALRQMATELENGALLIIDPSRTRLRVLPLQLRH